MTPTIEWRGKRRCDCGPGASWESKAMALGGPGAGECQVCRGFLRNPRATVLVTVSRNHREWVHPTAIAEVKR